VCAGQQRLALVRLAMRQSLHQSTACRARNERCQARIWRRCEDMLPLEWAVVRDTVRGGRRATE
jgi:hypothetical protein